MILFTLVLLVVWTDSGPAPSMICLHLYNTKIVLGIYLSSFQWPWNNSVPFMSHVIVQSENKLNILLCGCLEKCIWKKKTAHIVKASHCRLEQNAEQKLQMPRSLLRGKVNSHTSHLFSALGRPGRGVARRSTLKAGIKGTWAAKHHMGVCATLR